MKQKEIEKERKKLESELKKIQKTIDKLPYNRIIRLKDLCEEREKIRFRLKYLDSIKTTDV